MVVPPTVLLDLYFMKKKKNKQEWSDSKQLLLLCNLNKEAARYCLESYNRSFPSGIRIWWIVLNPMVLTSPAKGSRGLKMDAIEV